MDVRYLQRAALSWKKNSGSAKGSAAAIITPIAPLAIPLVFEWFAAELFPIVHAEAVARTATNDISDVMEGNGNVSIDVAHHDVLNVHVSVTSGVKSLLFRKRVPIITL